MGLDLTLSMQWQCLSDVVVMSVQSFTSTVLLCIRN